jgi:hypothetical protein
MESITKILRIMATIEALYGSFGEAIILSSHPE